MKIGRITVSDRASAGIYEDRSGPEIESVLREVFKDATFEAMVVPDETDLISAALKKLADHRLAVRFDRDDGRHGNFRARRDTGGDRGRLGKGTAPVSARRCGWVQ